MNPAHDAILLRSLRGVVADAALRESLLVSLLVALASAGLTVIVAWFWVVGHALVRTKRPHAKWLVVCGHALSGNLPSATYQARLRQAERLAAERPDMQLLLCGGGTPSEAAVGRDWLLKRDRVDPARIVLERRSKDTFENLRQARTQIPGNEKIAIVSSRFHLGRIRLYAAQLGLTVELIPAESAWTPTPGNLLVSLREAAFVCWFVTGKLWARLARREHLLARLR